MFRFQFDCKSSAINRYSLIFTGISLVLAIIGQINRINIIGAAYVIALRLLGKIDSIKYALSISLTGCVYDFFYVCFHSSNSSWLYIKFIEFILHFSAFIFEIMWILCVFCYLKQEETKEVNTNEVTWIEKQMDKMMPKIGNLLDLSANPTKLTTSKELQDDNNERSETDANLAPNNKLEQPTSSNKPLDESVAENTTNKISLKEPTKNDIKTKNNVPVEKYVEPSPGNKSKFDTIKNFLKKSEQTPSLNEPSDALTVNNEPQPTSSKNLKKDDSAVSNNEPLENNTISSHEEKSEKDTTKDSKK